MAAEAGAAAGVVDRQGTQLADKNGLVNGTQGKTFVDFGRNDVLGSRERVYRLAYSTPLVDEPPLSARFGGKILSKLENLQNTGSFKVRGAANKVLSLDPAMNAGVIAASAGNHARGVARAARLAGIPSTLVMPIWAPIAKYTAAQREEGRTRPDRPPWGIFRRGERHAVLLAKDSGLTMVHPFDDPMVIAGQGTVGCEIADEVGPPGSIYIPVGGGGLLAGIAVALKDISLKSS